MCLHFHVLDYFVKWWYFSFGKSFFETSHCSMFIIMSTIIPQSFTFFGIYLIFLNRVLKSALKPIFLECQFSVDRYGRPVNGPFVSIFPESRRSIGPVDRELKSVDRQNFRSTDDGPECFLRVFALIGRPTEFSVDRQYSRWLLTAISELFLWGLFCHLFWGFLLRFLVGIYTPLLMSFQIDKREF